PDQFAALTIVRDRDADPILDRIEEPEGRPGDIVAASRREEHSEPAGGEVVVLQLLPVDEKRDVAPRRRDVISGDTTVGRPALIAELQQLANGPLALAHPLAAQRRTLELAGAAERPVVAGK